jgi:hypothetical protein
MKPDPTRRIKRKQRTKSKGLCPHCGYFNCDSLHGWINTPYIRKLEKRKRQEFVLPVVKKNVNVNVLEVQHDTRPTKERDEIT